RRDRRPGQAGLVDGGRAVVTGRWARAPFGAPVLPGFPGGGRILSLGDPLDGTGRCPLPAALWSCRQENPTVRRIPFKCAQSRAARFVYNQIQSGPAGGAEG